MLPVVSHEAKTGRWPLVTVCLVGLSVLVFLFELSMGPRFVPFLQDWGLVPARVNAEITAHNMATVLTSLFLHVSVIHLLSNMWFLLVFGDAVEDALGWRWFLFLYLLCGFFGGIAFMATSGDSPIPAVGASGAISGVMAASLVMWPRARLKVPGVLLLLFALSLLYEVLALLGMSPAAAGLPLAIVLFLLVMAVVRSGRGFLRGMWLGVDVPALAVLGLYFGLQVFNGLLTLVNPAFGGSVGWWAHIGGFVSGAVFAWIFPKSPVTLRGRAVLG